MADNQANLKIQVTAGDLDKMRDSLRELRDEAEGVRKELKGLKNSSEETDEGLQDAAAAGEQTTSGFASLKGGVTGLAGKLGRLAGPAGALVAVGTGLVALKNFTIEATREINQGLLDAIEDASRGSEEATEKFEGLENVMRNVRGQTDLLKFGYDNLEEATADATRRFVENEAVLRTIQGTSGSFKDKLRQLAIDGYEFLRRNAVQANVEIVNTELAAGRASEAVIEMSRILSQGVGTERLTGAGQALANLAAPAVVTGFEEAISLFNDANNEADTFGYTLEQVRADFRQFVLAQTGAAGTIDSNLRQSILALAEQEAAQRLVWASYSTSAEEANLRIEELAVTTDQSGASIRGETEELAKNYDLRLLIVEQIRKEADALERLGSIKAGQAEKDEIDNNAEKLAEFREAELERQAEFAAAQQALLQENLDEQQRISDEALALHKSKVATGATSVSGILSAVLEADAKSRREALKKSLGQELLVRGGALVAQGIGNVIALNPLGALQIAGGTSMIAAGAKLGGVGGGGGGAGGARTAPRETAAPVPNVTFNQLTSFGFVGDRRSATREIEDINRRSVARGL